MASCLSVFTLVSIVGAFILGLIGFATPFWAEDSGYFENRTATWGLWERCLVKGNGSCQYYNKVIIPGWFQAVRILVTISLASGCLAFWINVFYLCCKPCKNSVVTVQLGIISLMTAFVLGLLALTIFGIKQHDDQTDDVLAWSFYVVMTSIACFLLAMILSICEMSNTRRLAVYKPIE